MDTHLLHPIMLSQLVCDAQIFLVRSLAHFLLLHDTDSLGDELARRARLLHKAGRHADAQRFIHAFFDHCPTHPKAFELMNLEEPILRPEDTRVLYNPDLSQLWFVIPNIVAMVMQTQTMSAASSISFVRKTR